MPIVESDYVKVLKKSASSNIIIAFSAIAEKGKFNFYRLMSDIEANVILVNSTYESAYQFGIPGIGGLEESVDYLNDLCLDLVGEHSFITVFGCSIAGYGALLYGSMLNAGKIIALSPLCPLFSRRKSVQNNAITHADQYKLVRHHITESPNKKFIIFGGVAARDHASANEFKVLKNSEIRLIEGMAHKNVEPLLHNYGMDFLLSIDNLGFLRSDIDFSDPIHDEYSTIILAFHYSQDQTLLGPVVDVASRLVEEIIKSHFYTTLLASILSKHLKGDALTTQYLQEALAAHRPVSLLSLELLVDNGEQFENSFILDYLERGIAHANDKKLSSNDIRQKITKGILAFLNSLPHDEGVEAFYQRNGIDSSDRNVDGGVIRKGGINDMEYTASNSPDDNAEKITKESKEESTGKDTVLEVLLSHDMEIADILRETAIAYQELGRVDVANIIMQQALIERPEGPYIKRKLEEYRLILSPSTLIN